MSTGAVLRTFLAVVKDKRRHHVQSTARESRIPERGEVDVRRQEPEGIFQEWLPKRLLMVGKAVWGGRSGGFQMVMHPPACTAMHSSMCTPHPA